MIGFKLILIPLLTQFFLPLTCLARETPVVKVVRRVSPAIVNIRTEEITREVHNKEESMLRKLFSEIHEEEEDFYENIGSGVVIHPRGIVLTNEHLISKAISIRVRFINGKEYEADVLGCDPEFDLAILKIRNGGEFPYLKLKKRDDLMVGEDVIVIGNPYGLSSSVSTGVISALGRNLRVENKVFANLIQTDAAINPGNSGGALLDFEGNLIGIVTAVLGEGKGIGFAIPSSDIEYMITDLLETKRERPIMGIFVEKIRDGPRFSLLVKKVIEKSPAEKYGLQKGDRIVEINNKRLKEGFKLKNIADMFREKDHVLLKILRGDEEHFLRIHVKDLINFKPTNLDERLLDIRVLNISPYSKLKYKIKEKKGAIVSKAIKGGIGYTLGIRAGDLILKVNNVPVESKEDFERLMLEGIKKNYLLYQIVRNKSTFFLPLKFENLL
ncbi:MAG: trypsin-like peptidase domain-containing protein [Deltaproteobacteria bacterium]|nr:trypsin-like peptidase domain-containing protein [Deltaproteobacteria bacterium]